MIIGLVLLGFGLLSLLSFIGLLGLWAFIVILFPISDFQTYIFWTYVVIGICSLDLMVLYLTRYYNLEFIIISVFIFMLFFAFILFRENRVLHFWYQSGVPTRLRPGMAIFGDSVLSGFIRFSNISWGFGNLEMKINSTFPFSITPF